MTIGASATKLTAWGNPSRFEIALGWAVDEEPRDRRPAHGGWSTGEMRLTVGGLVLTRHVQAGVQHDASRWFLLPVVEWLAASWISLLHEERFAWRENEALPAASAVVVALDRWIGSTDAAGRAAYRSVQAWWSRHAMRACDPSALYPDIVMRRLGVALAGETYAPAILINLASHYNKIRSGQRFTAAHELFHILYDQRRARRVAHTSGPWASAGVEKRANAFAAMLLMPRQLLQWVHRRNRWSAQSVADAAIAMDVGASALTEHLYNTTLIDEGERDRLRAEFRSSLPARPRPASGRGRTASPSRF